MIIQIDSREKNNKEITRYFDLIGQKYFVSKLYAGDYCNPQNQSIVVELKKDLVELANNLGKEHDRFRREILRASDMGAKMVILIREPGLKTIEDVFSWRSPINFSTKKPRTTVKGSTLAKQMITMEKKYGVKFKFCSRIDAGREILKILGGKDETITLKESIDADL